MDLRNKKVTVVGLGASGLASALLLDENEAIVFATDSSDSEPVRKNASFLKKKYIETEIGRHTESFLEGTELFVVSPGVDKDSTPICYALKNNVPVISEIELGCYFCRGPIIAVTGTNGKSTVVSLLGKILAAAGKPFNVCGNIGKAFTGEVKNITKETFVILEVSSFQLERIETFRPLISVILNITEDHMDRYRSFKDYEDVKKRIFKNQKDNDITILNYDLLKKMSPPRPFCRTFYFSAEKKVEGAYKADGAVNVFLRNKEKKLFNLDNLNLKGEHNTENILAATLVALLIDVDAGLIEKVIKDFKPLSHRFETLRAVGGVEFINDSKATNIDSTRRALKSLEKKAVLIAGGKDKALSYEEIVPSLKKHVKSLVLIGETKEKIKKALKNAVPLVECNTMEDAVGEGYRLAGKGGCVLLSPMCASFDMFANYKERGEAFKRAVEKLRNKS